MFNNIAMPIYAAVNRAKKSVGRDGEKKQFKSGSVDRSVSSGTSGLTGKSQRDDRKMTQMSTQKVATGKSQVATGAEGMVVGYSLAPGIALRSKSTGQLIDIAEMDRRSELKYKSEIADCLKLSGEEKLKALDKLVVKYSGRLNNGHQECYQNPVHYCARMSKKAFSEMVPCTDLLELCLSKYKKEDGTFDDGAWERLLKLLPSDKAAELKELYESVPDRKSLYEPVLDAHICKNVDLVNKLTTEGKFNPFIYSMKAKNSDLFFDIIVRVRIREIEARGGSVSKHVKESMSNLSFSMKRASVKAQFTAEEWAKIGDQKLKEHGVDSIYKWPNRFI